MAGEVAELAGSVAELLFEGFAEGGVGVVAGGQGDFGDVDGAHAELPAGALEADAADVGGDVFAFLGGEDAVEVGDGIAGNGRKDFAVEGLVDVVADVLVDFVDALFVVLIVWCVSHVAHYYSILEQLFATSNVSFCR